MAALRRLEAHQHLDRHVAVRVAEPRAVDVDGRFGYPAGVGLRVDSLELNEGLFGVPDAELFDVERHQTTAKLEEQKFV